MTPDSYHFLFGVLLTAQVLICVVMGGLILIQRSEGGALGMGGGPSGFMSARGTGNLLTSLTSWFGIAFFVCSIALTIVGNRASHTGSVVDQTDLSKLTLTPPAATSQPAAADTSSSSGPSLANLPLAGTAPASQAPAPSVTAPARSAPASSRAAEPTIILPSMSSSSASSPTADQIAKAKASVFRNASSSAAPATTTAPAASSSSAPQ